MARTASRSTALDELRDQAAGCTRCPLYRDATQTVFGAGSPRAPIFMVGEQPGDKEDLAGEPFVGPAGQLLHRAMTDAGIAEDAVYLTNAVKHFKHEDRGARRLHKKPNAAEVEACGAWIAGEIELVKPHLVVVLGATAARSLLGPRFRVTQHRGQQLPWQEHALPDLAQALAEDAVLVPTVHPSSVLRSEDRAQAYDAFVDDLRVVARAG